MKLLLNLVLFVNLLQGVKGYLNYTEASKRCRKNGELASFEHFGEKDRTLTLNVEQANNLTLQNGESAWIKGYAKFSTFLSWYGCYSCKSKYFNVTEHTPGHNIYKCSNYCLKSKKDLKYIGLQRDTCICLTSVEFKKLKLEAYSDEQCQNLNDTAVDDKLMTELVKVYEILKAEELYWKPKPAKLKQCVYATVRNSTSSYETHSCLTLSGILTIHGFVCVNSMFSNLNGTCSTYYPSVNDTPAACFVGEMSSWIEARNRCHAFNGKLISDIPRSLRGYAQTNLKYWTGIFRSFTTTLDHKQNYACLAATRVNNDLILDPDDCNVPKRFLCNDNLTNIHTTKTTENNTSTETTMWRIQNTTSNKIIASTEKSKGKSSETNGDLYTYVSAGVSVFLALITVVIIIVVCRSRKSRIRKTQRRMEEKKNENNVVYAEAYNLTTLKDGKDYSRNPKSENEKEQYHLAQEHYDSASPYIYAGGATDYDKVNLKYKSKGGKVENMGSNIYDQTKCVSDLDHYNVVGNIDNNRSQSHTDRDGTYSKFCTGVGDYDSLNRSKKDTIASASNERKGRTDNTYDTMK